MKRSEINHLISEAKLCFADHGWALPPQPRWDVTDFGLGDWRKAGLVLVNLAEEPEYCEKLMFALEEMETPTHSHRIKKEDIICRWGKLQIHLSLLPDLVACKDPHFKIDGVRFPFEAPTTLTLEAGQRVTLVPGVLHSFKPLGGACIIGEVSTANDDLTDNVFLEAKVGRYAAIEEDEPACERLLND